MKQLLQPCLTPYVGKFPTSRGLFSSHHTIRPRQPTVGLRQAPGALLSVECGRLRTQQKATHDALDCNYVTHAPNCAAVVLQDVEGYDSFWACALSASPHRHDRKQRYARFRAQCSSSRTRIADLRPLIQNSLPATTRKPIRRPVLPCQCYV